MIPIWFEDRDPLTFAWGRVSLWLTGHSLIQFQLMVPVWVVFAKGVLPKEQERKVPFRQVQEMEIPVNGKGSWVRGQRGLPASDLGPARLAFQPELQG